MTVSHDDVRLAYRMILGREPENDDVVHEHAAVGDLAELRRKMLDSAEFRWNLTQSLTVGRYINAGPVQIETQGSPDQVTRMVAQIAREWTRFGEQDAHWSVLVNDDFRAQNIGAHEDEFYATAASDVDQILSMVRRSRPDARLGRVLDFGCGVGRLTLALADHAESVTGLDISAPHIAWARQRADKTGVTNAEFTTIGAIDDIARYGDNDLIVTLIVLQHNPPPTMALILRALLDTLAPGGLAVFQIPTYLDGYSFAIDRYFAEVQASMEMNVLPQHVIFDIVRAAGCHCLEVREDGRVGDMPGLSHIFLVEKA